MKKKIVFLPIFLIALSSCSLIKGMEHQLSVTFVYNDEIIASKNVNEFTNATTPKLKDEMVPINHEFYGWTWLDPDTVKISDEDFETKYIAYDEVVHYHDVKNYANNSNVTLYPLFINIDDIPIPNYYIAIGWYAKSSTSGLTKEIINNWTNDLKTFLKNQGATDEDLSNVVIKGYEGDVATAGSLITKDRFVDVLLGFGNNIDSLGGVNCLEKDSGIVMGGKNRVIARLSEKETGKKVYDWLKTDDGNKSLRG